MNAVVTSGFQRTLLLAALLCLPAVAFAQTPPAPAPDAATPAAAPPAAEPGATGALEIACDVPGLEVKVDGNTVGRTPLRVPGLTAGNHRVELTQLSGEPLVKEVAVQPGMVTRWEAVMAGGPVMGPNDTVAPASTSGTARAAEPKGPTFPVSWGKYVFMVLEPFAWVGAIITGGALLTCAIMLTLVRSSVPLVGSSLEQIGDVPWRGLQIGAAAVTLVVGAITVLLFVFPTLPLIQMVLGHRDDAATGTN